MNSLRQESPSQRALLFFRSLFFDGLPLLSLIALAVLTVVPLSTPHEARVGALWPLIGITFWSLARPRSVPVLTVFAIGLLTDIVTFLPLGLHALVFVIAQYMIHRQRRFLIGQGFWVVWAALAVLLVCAALVIHGMITLLRPGTIPLQTALWGMALAWGCAPLLLAVLNWLNDIIDLFDEPVP